MPDPEFAGRVAMVTGAASGIGRSTLTAFLEKGAKGVLVDIDEEWGILVSEELRRRDHDIIFVKTDVSRSRDVGAVFEETLRTFGRVDILVNAVGIRVRNEVVDMTEEEWDAQLDVQLKGTFLMCREAARQMIKQGSGGRIISMGSNVYAVPHRGSASHGVSKAGVVHLTKVMALELAHHNITVNVVAPSITEVAWPQRKAALSPEFLKNFLAEVPMGRMVRPDENVHAVLFFASEGARFITGQVLNVDGGYSAGKLSVHGPTTPWRPPSPHSREGGAH